MGLKLTVFSLLFVVFLSWLSPVPVKAGGGIGMNTPSEASLISELSTSSKSQGNINLIDNSPKLAEIIAFHIALIAFFIPLSVEMVGRISERYGSGIISNYYKREIIPWAIFGLSIFNIFLSVLLMFFSITSKALNYISLSLFTLTLILIIPFLYSLYQYLTDINAVIRKVTKDVKDII